MNLRRSVRRVFRMTGYDVMLLPRLGVDCVLDVGAHRGEFGRLLRTAGFRGRIVSFEPAAEDADLLAGVAGRDPAWLVRREALGRVDGRMELHVSRQSEFNSFRTPTPPAFAQFPGAAVQRLETVDVRRLDSVFADCVPAASSRVYLKLDTQGWDLEVLAGASESLPRIVGLQSEVSFQPIYDGMPGYLEAMSTIEGLGFTVSGFFPVSRDSHLRFVEADCVAVRSGPARDPRP
jgi:FkbM family methyltransferase